MKKLKKRISYTYLDPRVPGIVQAVASCPISLLSSVQEENHNNHGNVNSSTRPDTGSFKTDVLGHLRRDLHIDEHLVSLKDLYTRLDTNPYTGLTESQVKINMEKYGENVFEPPEHTPEWLVLLKHLFGGFSSLLLIGAILCFWAAWVQRYFLEDLTNEYIYVGAVLIFVIFVSGACSYYQERKRDVIMESFQKAIAQSAQVIREGTLQEVDVTDLVVGDIVQIKYGDKVPADLRLIQCANLKVDNSILTGDATPQQRCVDNASENPLESKNLCFYATVVVKGCGKAVVINVGRRTMLGRIAGTASQLETNDTPIAQEVEGFVRIISTVAIVIGLIFFGLAILLGNSWLESTVFLIGLIVANIPEGLLATVTICLALTAKKMSDKNCVAKHLEAVETLGFVNCVCFDKTGLITKDEVTVANVWYSGRFQSFEADGDISLIWLRTLTTCPADEGFIALANAAVLSSRRSLLKRSDFLQSFARSTATDHTTEAAILECFQAFVGELELTRTKFSKVCEMGFNSLSKFHASVHEIRRGDSNFLLVLKGAPEAILDYCDTILIGNEEVTMNEHWRTQVQEYIRAFGEMGERVVGFCDNHLPSNYSKQYVFDPENMEFLSQRNFRFLGLISLKDPIRCSVPDAVRKCKSAGIKLIMVTADHPIMAYSIAKHCGITAEGKNEQRDWSMKNTRVMHGEELQSLDVHELDKILKENENVIFARTCPQQKLEIVEACQRLGWVLAVTGQAISDSPALRKADVGIALGIRGSDVAKDAADVIIVDDNFSSIVTGIEEGRIIFDNLKKCVAYALTDNMAELAHFFIFLLVRIPLPLGTISILCLDLGTDIVPSVSLIYERGESEVMKKPPRSLKEKLVTPQLVSYAYGQIGLIEAFAAFFSYTVVMAENGFLLHTLVGVGDDWNSEAINDLEDSYGQEWTYEQRKQLEMTSSTAYFVAVVVAQWANLLVCKTAGPSIVVGLARNNVLNFALVFETLVAAFLVYTPVIYNILNLRPIRLLWWLSALPFALLILLYDEARRYLIRRHPDFWITKEFHH